MPLSYKKLFELMEQKGLKKSRPSQDGYFSNNR